MAVTTCSEYVTFACHAKQTNVWTIHWFHFTDDMQEPDLLQSLELCLGVVCILDVNTVAKDKFGRLPSCLSMSHKGPMNSCSSCHLTLSCHNNF